MRAVRLTAPTHRLAEFYIEATPLGPDDVEVRVKAAGICRSDVHYRAGTRPVPRLPITPGHEIAGTVSSVGTGVSGVAVGDRVALNYLISCGDCEPCLIGLEQFCTTGQILGLSRDGGYAESVVVPARNAFRIPDSLPMEVAAIMMCSSATSLHALRRGRFLPGETVAVFGCGGLGMSAIKIAIALGAERVYGVDINTDKLAMVEELGAVPVPFDQAGTVSVDVALELVGLPATMKAAVACLAVRGRAVAVGITHDPFPLDSFGDLVLREAEVIGSSDHLADEIDELIDMFDRGLLDLSDVVTSTIPLEAATINEAMDRLETFQGGVRTVITP